MLFRNTHPGADMHFVNGVGGIEGILPMAALHPLLIVPLVSQIPDHGSSARRWFMEETDRISLVYAVPLITRRNVEFVDLPFAEAGNKSFPNAGTAPRLERM